MNEEIQLLKDYVATATNPKYGGDWNVINSKFPEFNLQESESSKGVQAEQNGGLASVSVDTDSSLESQETKPKSEFQKGVEQWAKKNELDKVWDKEAENRFGGEVDAFGNVSKYGRTMQANELTEMFAKNRELNKKIIDKTGIDVKDIKKLDEDVAGSIILDALANSGVDTQQEITDKVINEASENIKENINKELQDVSFYESDAQNEMKLYGTLNNTKFEKDIVRNKPKRTEDFDQEDYSKLKSVFGDVSKYGINEKDFLTFIKDRGNDVVLRSNEFSDINFDITRPEQEKQETVEYLKGKTLSDYLNRRGQYLINQINKLEIREKNGEKIDESTYSKFVNEAKDLDRQYKQYYDDNLPQLKILEENNKKELRKEYQKATSGQNLSRLGTELSKVVEGIENPIYNASVVFQEKVLGDVLGADTTRAKRAMEDHIKSNNISYSYVDGKESTYQGRKYIVDKDNNVYDPELKVNVNRILEPEELEQIIKNKTNKSESSYSFLGTTGMVAQTIGDLGVQILATRGLGRAISPLGIPKSAILSNMVATGGMVYSQTYVDVLNELEAKGYSGNEAKEMASDTASKAGIFTALTSAFSPNLEAQKALSTSRYKKLINEAVNVYQKEGKKGFMNKVNQSFSNYMKKSIPESAQEVIQENLETGYRNILNDKMNQELGENVFNTEFTKKDFIDNSVGAFVATSLINAPASFSVNEKAQIFDKLNEDYSKFEKTIDNQVVEGFVSKTDAEQLKKQVLNYGKYINKIPDDIPQDQVFEVIDLVDQRNELETQKKNLDKAFQPKINEEINQVQSKINDIINYDEEKTTTDAKPKEDISGLQEETVSMQEQGETEIDEKVEIEPIDLSETLKINDFIKALEGIDQDLTKYSKETLGVNFPVVVAQGAVKAMTVAAKGTKVTVDAISAGTNYVRNTNWYKNLSDSDRNEYEKQGLLRALNDLRTSSVKTKIEELSTELKTAEGDKKATIQTELDKLKKRTLAKTTTEKIVKAQQKGVKQPIKTEIRKGTGQVDISKKIKTTEAKLLKEKFKNLERGFKTGTKEANQFKKDFVNQVKETIKGLGGELSDFETKGLLNKVSKVNPKNIGDLQKNIDDLALKIENRIANKELRKTKSSLKKKSKSKSKLYNANQKQTAKQVVSVDERYLSKKSLEEYKSLTKDVEDSFKGVLKEDYKPLNVQEVSDKLRKLKDESDNRKLQTYIDQSGGEYESMKKELWTNDEEFSKIIEQSTKQKVDKIRNSLIEVLSDKFNELTKKTKEGLSDENAKLLNKLKKIDNFNKLETTNLKKFIKVIDNITINDDFSNVGDIISDYEGNLLSEEMSGALGDNVIKVNKSILGSIKSLVKSEKFLTSDKLYEKVENNMLQHIDSVIRAFKGTKLYETVIQPFTSKNELVRKETSRVSEQLTTLLRKGKTLRKGNRAKRLGNEIYRSLGFSSDNYEFDLNVLLQMYFREREYLNNSEHQGKKVHKFKTHLDQMKKNPQNTDLINPIEDLEYIEKKFKQFSDKQGNVDIDKLFNYFNKYEKELVKLIDEELLKTKDRSQHINSKYRNETLEYFNNYFPRKSGAKIKSETDLDFATSQIDKLFNILGVKDSSSNERVVGAVEPLNFNTLDNFIDHVQGVNLEYHLTEYLMNINNMVKKLSKKGGEKTKLALLLQKTVRNMTQVALNTANNEPISNVGKLFNAFKRKTFSKILIDPIKLALWDLPTNWGVISLANAYRTKKIIKANKDISQDLQSKIMNEFGSVHIERFGSRSVDFKETMHSTIKKSKYRTLKPSFTDNVLDFLNKNQAGDLADYAADLYYKVTDLPLQYLWRTELQESFNDITGKSITDSNYNEIKDKYEKELKRAIAQADKKISNVFNTAAYTEQKIAIQKQSPSSWKKMIDSFMRSFAFNEYRVFWSSLKNMLGVEKTMTKEEAYRNFVIMNLRGIAYSYLSQIMMDVVFFDRDDEELEELSEKSMGRAIAQHLMLIGFGNLGNISNVGLSFLVESLREVYIEKDKDEKYNMYEDGLLYSVPKRGSITQYSSLLGAEGEVLKTGLQLFDWTIKMTEKWAKGEKITKEDYADGKSISLALNLISQTTGLSFYRAGKLFEKAQKEEEKKQKNKRK